MDSLSLLSAILHTYPEITFFLSRICLDQREGKGENKGKKKQISQKSMHRKKKIMFLLPKLYTGPLTKAMVSQICIFSFVCCLRHKSQ